MKTGTSSDARSMWKVASNQSHKRRRRARGRIEDEQGCSLGVGTLASLFSIPSAELSALSLIIVNTKMT